MNDKYRTILELVERELIKIVPRKITANWIRDYAVKQSYLSCEESQIIMDPARDLIFRGGKRWRPVLMVLFCEMTGENQNVLPLTPIVELMHNGSLIIDDIEDKSEFRRGAPAVHMIYGMDLSINTGNLLYFLPLSILEQDDIRLKMESQDLDPLFFYDEYNRQMRKLHFGQGLDIQWHNDVNHIPDQKAYMTMCAFKTGSLAGMSATYGTYWGSGSSELARLAGEIAEKMGVGFQIMDDVKNLVSGNPGKKRGDDIVERKKSLPVIIHLTELEKDENLKKEFLGYLSEASEKGIDEGNQAVEAAIKLMEKSGAIEAAKIEGLSLLDEAENQLEKNFPANDARDLILSMIRSFA